MRIPSGVALALLLLTSVVVLALGIFNFFASKFGMDRDTVITGVFALFVGTVLRFLVPSRNTSDDESQGPDEAN